MAAVRILHLHSSFDLGGKEARAARLMNHFGDQAEHVVLTAVPGAYGARDALDRKIKVSFPGADAPSLAGMPAMGRYRKLAAYMKRFHLVLSYNWGAMDGVMAHTLLNRSMGLPPLIHHEDGFNDDEVDGLKKRRNWFRTIALQRSDALVVPSKTLENIARKEWHQPLEKIARFPNGIDIAHYNRRPQRGSFPGFVQRDGEIVVGTIAGLRAVKNLPRLVRAVAAVGPNVRLAIADAAWYRRPCYDAWLLARPGPLCPPVRYFRIVVRQRAISDLAGRGDGKRIAGSCDRCRRCSQYRCAGKSALYRQSPRRSGTGRRYQQTGWRCGVAQNGWGRQPLSGDLAI
jgi:glycosyltransferase involved in cell wall biosynthesis